MSTCDKVVEETQDIKNFISDINCVTDEHFYEQLNKFNLAISLGKITPLVFGDSHLN